MQQETDSTTAQQLTQDMIMGCLGVRVGRLHRLVTREFEKNLRPLGLSLQQLEMLSTLTACKGPVRPSVVADLLAVERSTVSRNLAVMTQRGWVRAVGVSSTGRSLTVEITPTGTSTLAHAVDAWGAAQSALNERLESDAVSTLDHWLAALTADRAPVSAGDPASRPEGS